MSLPLRRLLVPTLAALIGCTTPPVGRADLLDFLRDGTTTRAEVHLRLGEPSSQYEQDRVLAYRLAKDAGGFAVVRPQPGWAGVSHNLMLAFDADGVLRRHALVEVKAP